MCRPPHRDGPLAPGAVPRAAGRAARGVLELGRARCTLAGAQGHPACRLLRRRAAAQAGAQDAGMLPSIPLHFLIYNWFALGLNQNLAQKQRPHLYLP